MDIHTFSVSRGLNCSLILALGERKCRKIHKELCKLSSEARLGGRTATADQYFKEATLLEHIMINIDWSL